MYIRYMLLLFIIMLTSWIKILNNRHNGCYLWLETDHSWWSFTSFPCLFLWESSGFSVEVFSLLWNNWRLQPVLLTSPNPPLIGGTVIGSHLMASALLLKQAWQAAACRTLPCLKKEGARGEGGINSQNPDFGYSESNKKIISFFPRLLI